VGYHAICARSCTRASHWSLAGRIRSHLGCGGLGWRRVGHCWVDVVVVVVEYADWGYAAVSEEGRKGERGECWCLREGGGDVGRYSRDGRYGWSSFLRFTDLAVCDAHQRFELVGYLKSGFGSSETRLTTHSDTA
jgi:hypothetical protein